ncbi:MAG: hypothetical protein OXI87_18960 [Albidovulum sp.]|nr:hypothetical protein [Albidovulum sp.]
MQILDLYHVLERLSDVAKAIHSRGDMAKALAKRWRGMVKAGRLRATGRRIETGREGRVCRREGRANAEKVPACGSLRGSGRITLFFFSLNEHPSSARMRDAAHGTPPAKAGGVARL